MEIQFPAHHIYWLRLVIVPRYEMGNSPDKRVDKAAAEPNH